MRHNAASPRPPTAQTRQWFEAEPLWFKRAVFYEIHIRGFFDANGDGSGDFRGLTEKLDYLQWLGIDCIWLLPFYQSPLRDGGYDIADFYDGPPRLRHASTTSTSSSTPRTRAGIRVIADLVMNHTSSDHPWFQESRSQPGLAQARLVRVVGHRRPLPGRADHLHRHRDLELDLGPGRRRLLLAPLLLPPARPQLRQPRGPGGDARRAALLARPRRSTASGSTPCRTCTSARARTARTCPRPTPTSSGCAREVDEQLPGPRAAGRGQPVAGRRRRVLRRRRRVPHGVPLPGHAAHVHGDPARGGGADLRDPRADAGRSRTAASGASSCATTTS